MDAAPAFRGHYGGQGWSPRRATRPGLGLLHVPVNLARHLSVVIPAKRRAAARRSGTHMWTAPGLQGRSRGTDRIDCDHMSGLLLAVHMTACLDGFRDASSKQHSGFNRCHWVPTECLASGIDRSHHLLRLEQAPASAQGRSLLRRTRYAFVIADASAMVGVARREERGAEPPCSAATRSSLLAPRAPLARPRLGS